MSWQERRRKRLDGGPLNADGGRLVVRPPTEADIEQTALPQ
jgi:hypothetical protein